MKGCSPFRSRGNVSLINGIMIVQGYMETFRFIEERKKEEQMEIGLIEFWMARALPMTKQSSYHFWTTDIIAFVLPNVDTLFLNSATLLDVANQVPLSVSPEDACANIRCTPACARLGWIVEVLIGRLLAHKQKHRIRSEASVFQGLVWEHIRSSILTLIILVTSSEMRIEHR